MVAGLLLAPAVRADEPRAPGEPRLLRETAETTSVADAFDDGDLFDLHLFLGFEQRFRNSNIRRETAINQPGLSDGGYVATTENVAHAYQTLSMLNLGADIGIYKDLAIRVRLPIILNDSRELTDLDGSSANPQRRADPTGALLFPVPFKSPSRSGLDYIEAGLDYAIFNQRRDDTRPTWVIGLGGRFGIGSPLTPCRAEPLPGQEFRCPDPTGATAGSNDLGVSRAMNSFVATTTFSKRMGSFEPFLGFDLLVEFPQDRSVFGKTSNLEGALLNRPPLVGTVTTGVEFVPWEEREQFRRFVIDARVFGSYYSPGREYTELFDALGTSTAPSLRSPNPAAYTLVNGESGKDPNAGDVYFTGVTDVQSHGAFGGRVSVVWQAGEYIKFTAGFGLAFVQPHLITSADACNPDITNDPDRAGPCRSQNLAQPITGIPNPNHRAVIDLPGRRFSSDDTSVMSLSLGGVVMF